MLDDTTRQFLSLLHRGGQWGYWWTIEGRQSFWWEVGKMTALPGGRRNVYVGVHPTVSIPETNPRGEPAEPRNVRAQLAYIAAINCLYCEFDAKDYGGDKEAARQAAEGMAPAASVITDSGGGYHVYHLFDSPWMITSDDDREHAKRLQAAWVAYAGSDPQVKDLARVLRVPGTLNHKYSPARPVTYLVAALDRRYRREDLETTCAHLMEPERRTPQEAARVAPEDREQRYALGALDREVANVVRAANGKKHDTIRDAALKLGTFVPLGLLTEDQIIDELTRAAALHRDDVKDTYRTVVDGINYGKQRPRTIPDRPNRKPERRVDLATGEILDPPTEQEYITVPEWKSSGTTAAQLYHARFEPLYWTVEGILPEGAALLAGKPKSRKSWAALGVAVAVARGEKVMGKLATRQGRALYLDLESNQRRMRGRLFSMVGHQMRDMDNLHIYTDWPRAEEGLAALEAWMVAHPDTVLIVIDVAADFRRPRDPKEDIYAYDRETIKPLNAFAERHRITVLLVHHTRKAKSDDVFDEISGSTGLPSAVATMWVIGRAPDGDTILALRGRDLIHDEPLALEWDDDDNQFKIIGGAADAFQSGERRAVLKLMADDQEWTPKALAVELRKPVTNVQQLLKVLLSEGFIDRVGRGRYLRVLGHDQNDQNDQNTKITQNDQIVDSDLGLQDQNQDQNRLGHSKAIKSHSDHSDRDSREAPNLDNSTGVNHSKLSPHNGVPADYIPSEAGQQMIERLKAAKTRKPEVEDKE